MPPYPYLHLDVFTDRPFTGNQLAVFLDAEGIAPDIMQQIAREMAFPETTFVLPPESADTDVRVRIFTPGTELPMAGHPTIGTTFALVRAGRVATTRTEIVLGLGIGPTRVELGLGRRTPAFRVDDPARSGVRRDTDRHPGSGLGPGAHRSPTSVTPACLRTRPPQASPFLLVPIASRRAVDAVVVDRGSLSRVCRDAGMPELPVFLFSLESGGDDATVYSRMFAPEFGIAEDPATGSASGLLGAYLVRHGAVAPRAGDAPRQPPGGQDGATGPHSHLNRQPAPGRSARCVVGGAAVLVGEGTIRA